MKAQKVSPMTYTPDYEKINEVIVSSAHGNAELATSDLQYELDGFLSGFPNDAMRFLSEPCRQFIE